MLEIVFKDDQYVVINKPSGMLVHRTFLDRHETVFAVQVLRDQIGQKVFPVHRLDKPTSGLLLFALNEESLKFAQKQFETSTIKKRYLAIVRGYLSGNGRIDYPLKREIDKYTQAKSEVSQDAITDYKSLAQIELPYDVGRYPTARYTLVELIPETGRKHQLRRHMAHLRHPIVGDTRHGDGAHNRLFREKLEINRLMLHACNLSFIHPKNEKIISLSAGLDEPLSGFLEQMGVNPQEAVTSIEK